MQAFERSGTRPIVYPESEVGTEGGHLRFFLPGAERPIPTRAERTAEAEDRARASDDRARKAEAEVLRLREELDRLRRA